MATETAAAAAKAAENPEGREGAQATTDGHAQGDEGGCSGSGTDLGGGPCETRGEARVVLR